MVFTDGSVYEAAVGCGACAAVLLPLAGDDDKYSGSKAVGENVAAFTCELEGIPSWLELAVRYFQSSRLNTESTRKIFTFCVTDMCICN